MSEKCFRTLRVQLRLLESRGIIIKDKKLAKRKLAALNYYDLINGYKTLFLSTSNPVDKYKAGTRFEEVLAMYEFDRKLRIITLEVLLQFENQVKSTVAYTFSKYNGHKDYLCYTKFDSNTKQVGKLFSEIYRQMSDNVGKHDYLDSYINGKNYIPLWVLVNLFSFGQISKFYSLMIQSQREEVAKRIKWGIRENHLKNYLHFLGGVRNVCAHGERFYIHKNPIFLYDNSIYKYFRYKGPKDNYFSVLVALKLVLSKELFNEYCDSLIELLDILSSNIKTVNINDVTYIMGLPRRWERIKRL